jgi:uncharacterized protein (TIGR00266 family)
MQTLEVTLGRGESIFSETGCLLSMTMNVDMRTHAPGGLGGMFRRAFSGNSLLLNQFSTNDEHETVMFTTRMPGHIVPLDIGETGRVIVQRHSFLCAEEGIEYGTQATLNLGRFLGGNGLVFNYMGGHGMAFISVDGEVIEKSLGPRESILVHPGHIAAFTGQIEYEVQKMQGVSNFFLSGDGYYLVRLHGPGRIWMHSLTIHNLAHILAEYMPNRG